MEISMDFSWLDSEGSDLDDPDFEELNLSWLTSSSEDERDETCIDRDLKNSFACKVVLQRQPELDAQAQLAQQPRVVLSRLKDGQKPTVKCRRRNKSATGAMNTILTKLNKKYGFEKSTRSLVNTEQVCRMLRRIPEGHFKRNIFIYLSTAVQKSGAQPSLVHKAVERYRQKRRALDGFRYGHGQGSTLSIRYSEDYVDAFRHANESICMLEKLDKELDLSKRRVMTHWVQAMKQLAVILVNETSVRTAQEICQDDIARIQETTTGFSIVGWPGAKLTKKAGRLLLRYALLRRCVKNGSANKKLLINSALQPFDIYSSIRRKEPVHKKICRHCGRKYSACYLPIHMRTHTKERPFECKQCGSKFTDKCNLNAHLKTHK